MPGSIFAGLARRARNGTGGRGRRKNSGGGATPSAARGRHGVTSNQAADALSTSFQYTKAYTVTSVQQTDTLPLNLEDDAIGLQISLTVALTGNTSTTADQLLSLAVWQLIGPDGIEMNILPAPDFYQLEQRFSPLHVKPTVVALNGTTATSGTYLIYGINLPKSRGTYTLLPQIQAAAAITASTTGGTVTVTVDAILGDAGGKISHYVFSNLPFTPSASGVNDLAPVAPIQDTDLTELFISGLTSNTADISFIQTTKAGGRILPSTLVAKANSQMITALDADKLFPLFSLATDLNIGRGAHFYVQWGTSPSNTIRLGFYWLE